MWDLLFDTLVPTTKRGFALWGVALFVLFLIAAALVLGWAIVT